MRNYAIYFLVVLAMVIMLPALSFAAEDSGEGVAKPPVKEEVVAEDSGGDVAKPQVKEEVVAEDSGKGVAKPPVKEAVGAKDKGYGSVGGIIMVWRTRVETTGPRNLKDVIVYLESATPFPPVTGTKKQMDQRGLLFLPHVLPIQKGTSVEFLNNDPEKHNVFFLFDKTGETLDIGTWDKGQSVVHVFNEPGTITTLCKLHLEMAAHIIVLDNPYYIHAEIDGDTQRTTYLMDGIPPGEYVVKTWHKKLKMKGGQARIKVEAGKKTKVNIAITKRKYAK